MTQEDGEAQANPYRAPEAEVSGDTDEETWELVPLRVCAALGATLPWLRFVATLGWCASALLAGLGLISALVGVASIGADELGLGGGGVLLLLAFGYFIVAALIAYPTLCLWRSGGGIRRLVATREPRDLEFALAQQRSAWRAIALTALCLILAAFAAFAGLIVLGSHLDPI